MKSDNITFDEILKEFYIKTESELYRKKYIYGYNYRKETSELWIQFYPLSSHYNISAIQLLSKNSEQYE